MPETPMPEPFEVTMLVETFVNDEHRNAQRFDNRTLLDQSGVYDLHTLAAKIYALGFKDGRVAESVRENGVRQRERDAARAVAESPDLETGEQ